MSSKKLYFRVGAFVLVTISLGLACIVIFGSIKLGRGRPVVRLLVFFIVAATFWSVHAAATYTPPDPAQTTPWWQPMCRQAIVLGLESLLLAGCLWAVRLSGFRLLRSACEP